MRNELQRHKRSDKVKWVLTGIMFFLAFIMIAGLILQVFGTGKAKPSEWFKKSDSEQTEQLPAEGGENATAHMRVRAMAATLSTETQSESTSLNYPMSSAFVGNQSPLNYSPVGFVTSVSDFRADKSTSINVLMGNYTRSVPISRIAFECSKHLTQSNRDQTPSDKGKIIVYKDGLYGESTSYEIESFSIGLGGFSCTWFEYKDCFVSSEIAQGNLASNWGIMCYTNSVKTPVPLPDDPVKEGYVFAGWYYDEAFTRSYLGEDIYEDTQLYAKFRIKTFWVFFDSNGGSKVVDQKVDWNTAVTFTTPTREEYAFKGWYLSDGTQYMNQPIKEDTTLTAHWERNIFNATFDTDGGTVVEDQKVNLNEPVSLPTTTKTGYVFKGWYLSDGTQYMNQPIKEDTTLTAHWEVQTFTVTFYVDGEVYTTKIVEYGQGLVEAAEMVNLKVLSVRTASGALTYDESGAVIVSEDCTVEAQEMSNTDKVINTVKENKWAIIGGVAGGVALIAIIAAVCGSAKRKRRR